VKWLSGAAALWLTFSAHAAVVEFTREGEPTLSKRVATKPIAIEAWRALPVAWTSPAIEVRAKTTLETDDAGEQFTPAIAFAIGGHRYQIPIESWTRIGCSREFEHEIHAAPFAGGAVVSYDETFCGAHMSEDLEHLFVIDAKARVVELQFSRRDYWGYANAGIHRSDGTTTCRWIGDDAECTQTLVTDAPWAKVTSKRRFLAFARKRLRATDDARRLGALRGERVIVDRVGLLHRVVTAGDHVLYAAIDTDAALTATFHLTHARGVASEPAGDLIEPAPDRPSDDANGFTVVDDGITTKAALLARRGTAQLWSVLLQGGDEVRSVFWVAIDPADPEGRLAVLRVASTAEEGRDRELRVPPSLMSYKLIDGGAYVTVLHRWQTDFLRGPSCPDETADPDVSDGALTWSPDGFEIELVDRSQRAEPLEVTIDADGKIATKPREIAPR